MSSARLYRHNRVPTRLVDAEYHWDHSTSETITSDHDCGLVDLNRYKNKRKKKKEITST